MGYNDSGDNIYPIRVFVKREYKKVRGVMTCGGERFGRGNGIRVAG